MGWWKKKAARRAYDKEQSLIRGREIGAMLLEDLIQCCDGKSNPIKFFSADLIIKATNNFSESNHVSELSPCLYNWYSGKYENHPMLLIKKVVDTDYVCELKHFCRDISVGSMVSGHKNFMKLVGCCIEFDGPTMVYDDAKKHYRLDIRKQPWKRRMKIAEDIATALAYLHNAFPRPFVHRNMCLGNILLDEDGVAKLCDFFECVLIPEGETFVQVEDIVGVYAHMEKNYARNGIVSVKTDVFAIGIAMQQLLTGEERFKELCVVVVEEGEEEEETNEEGEGECDSYDYESMTKTVLKRTLPNWLSKFMVERRVEEIADPKMLEEMGEISEEELCRMNAFLMLSQRCIGLRGEVPTMVEVAKELRKIQRSLKDVFSSPSGETQFDSA